LLFFEDESERRCQSVEMPSILEIESTSSIFFSAHFRPAVSRM
jgi:hypothetical protein